MTAFSFFSWRRILRRSAYAAVWMSLAAAVVLGGDEPAPPPPPSGSSSPGPPGQMIEISATIYDFRYDKETQFGIFYQYNRTRGSFQDSNVFLPGTEKVQDTPIPALDLSGTFASLDYGAIEFNIKTALQEGWGTVISNPSVLASDGVKASIISGEVVPITVVKVQGNQTTLDTQNRDTGIKLIVTPHIFKSNYILMNLEVESSEITRFQLFDRGDGARYELPVVATRNIKSVVLIPNEKKLYIGGLYTDISGDLTRKVPVLGDVPGLGFFLRGFNKKKSRAETVFQITPIIRDPGFGITSQDVSIFSDLLEPEGNKQIINQYQLLDQVPSQAEGMIPNASAPANVRPATGQLQTGKSNFLSRRKPPAKKERIKPFRFQ